MQRSYSNNPAYFRSISYSEVPMSDERNSLAHPTLDDELVTQLALPQALAQLPCAYFDSCEGFPSSANYLPFYPSLSTSSLVAAHSVLSAPFSALCMMHERHDHGLHERPEHPERPPVRLL